MKPHITPAAQDYLTRMFPQGSPLFDGLAETDPELAERFCNFAFDQVIADGVPDGEPLDERTRFMTILALLLGCQGVDAFRAMLPAALDMDLEPVAVKEVVYQASAYLGMGRVAPFLDAVHAELETRGVALPLAGQATVGTSYEERAQAGEAKQVAYFGTHMAGFASSGNPEYPQINRWLSSHCFGDWYTRNGLTDQERELITFCFIAAQGGCEPQLTSHARANMNIGNSKALLLKVLSAGVPWIGYPRTLNAIRCVEEAAK